MLIWSCHMDMWTLMIVGVYWMIQPLVKNIVHK